jgi:hypothetical protein
MAEKAVAPLQPEDAWSTDQLTGAALGPQVRQGFRGHAAHSVPRSRSPAQV